MSTQLPTWRFHAVDPSLLVRVDQVDVEASVRPPRAKSTRPASSNAAGKAAATRKMDQLKEQIAVRRASHDLEQLKMQIAARQAAVAAPSAANVARVRKRSQQPAADGAEAGSSAAGAVSPAKRPRKAATAKPAPAAAPASAPPLGKVDNGRSLTTATAASLVHDDERSLTEGQLRRVLTALDAAGLLAAPGAEARAQAALRPLLAGPSAPAAAALLPLAAPPLPAADGPAAATRRSPAKKGVVARVPAKRGSAAAGKETGKAGKAGAASTAPAAATTATAAGAGAATVTTAGTAGTGGTAGSKSGGAPPAASVARASALLARHVARLGGAPGASEPAPISAALQQLLRDCRACLSKPKPNPNPSPSPSPNPHSSPNPTPALTLTLI